MAIEHRQCLSKLATGPDQKSPGPTVRVAYRAQAPASETSVLCKPQCCAPAGRQRGVSMQAGRCENHLSGLIAQALPAQHTQTQTHPQAHETAK